MDCALMDKNGILLIVTAGLGILEALVIIARPAAVQAMMREPELFTAGACRFMAAGYFIFGLGLWLLLDAGDPPRSTVLFGLGFLLISLASVWIRPSSARKLADWWIIRLTPLQLRIRYLLILISCLAIIYLA